jgi:transposase
MAWRYSTVRDCVRRTKMRRREAFVPLAYPPGHAQIDLGEAVGNIGGQRLKLHVFCCHLPHSDAFYLRQGRRRSSALPAAPDRTGTARP